MKRTFALIGVLVLGLGIMSAGAQTKITFWQNQPENMGTTDQAQIFNKQNPDINVDVVSFSDFPQEVQKLQIATVSGEKPDVVGLNYPDVPLVASMLDLVDLNTYLAKDKDVKLSNWTSQELIKNGLIDGKLIALHWYTNNVMMFYNKKLFRDAGLNPDRPPKTWDELVTMGQKMTKGDQYGFFTLIYHNDWYEFTSWYFQSHVFQNGGGTVWADDFSKTNFNRPEVVSALQWLTDLLYKYKISLVNLTDASFENGKVAMMEDGTWRIAQYEAALKGDLGAAFFPKSKMFATPAGGECLAVLKSDQNKQAAAWKWVKFCLTPAVQTSITQHTGHLALQNMANWAPYQTMLKNDPIRRVAMDNIGNSQYIPKSVHYAQASQMLADYIQQALRQKMTPSEALLKATADIDKMLAGN
jgi:ABC-type glycerol-3-phosphate transport system substrate-binding protein